MYPNLFCPVNKYRSLKETVEFLTFSRKIGIFGWNWCFRFLFGIPGYSNGRLTPNNRFAGHPGRFSGVIFHIRPVYIRGMRKFILESFKQFMAVEIMLPWAYYGPLSCKGHHFTSLTPFCLLMHIANPKIHCIIQACLHFGAFRDLIDSTGVSSVLC